MSGHVLVLRQMRDLLVRAWIEARWSLPCRAEQLQREVQATAGKDPISNLWIDPCRQIG
eukprot:NODE_29462_length_445_cov_3.022013.p5 GENE.NODE_29462_length_445_cov_3.022013~~NODE_29462_length_445_cov_3.022013.p5  ORF type:complete len:59 (-),score=3.99 NODE_29462_length_445_cov_3.022013:116-292(-)